MSIEIVNESGEDVDERSILSIAAHALTELGVHPLAELSVLLVDREHMASLHEKWMGEPGPTDVLSFPMDDLDPTRGPREVEPVEGMLGDVVLCPAVAAEQAQSAGHGTPIELALLTTHGILHLLGYDHGEPAEERTMFGVQDELMASWRPAGGASEPTGSGTP
ncbi:MAG: rRNA maturation RNase YbeY [Mycobacteriales bacterium]